MPSSHNDIHNKCFLFIEYNNTSNNATTIYVYILTKKKTSSTNQEQIKTD